MKKIWKRIIAGISGLVMSATIMIAPALVSLAAEKPVTTGVVYEVGDVLDFGDGKYVLRDYLTLGDYCFPLSGMWKVNKIEITEENDYKVELKNGDDSEYFYYPAIYGPDSFKFEKGTGTSDSPFGFFSPDKRNATDDWLDPLRTQLAIAADPEIGKNVKNTVEYTGDFALPAEIMQFLKDHPEVTLKYTFDYKGETHTVVIPGKSVVIEEGVPWYGFENLLGRYGK